MILGVSYTEEEEKTNTVLAQMVAEEKSLT